MENSTIKYPVYRMDSPLLEMVCRHYKVEAPDEHLTRTRPKLKKFLLMQTLDARFGPMVEVPVAFLKVTRRHRRTSALAS